MKATIQIEPFSRTSIERSPRPVGAQFGLVTALRRLLGRITDWRRQIRARSKYQCVCGLDDQVLAEIGLNRWQLRYDDREPVWWQ